MVQLTTDQIGDLGELIAAAALSRPVLGKYKRPLFKATHLGGKYKAVDFVVDVLGPNANSLGIFFVQVKSTFAHVKHARSRLPVKVDLQKHNCMVRLPIPTYLIGVELRTERAYIVSAFAPRQTQISSITRDYPLDCDQTRIKLYAELKSHWARAARKPSKTGFTDA